MPVSLDVFVTLAGSTSFSSRDLVVEDRGKTQTARLGNFVFSQGAARNDATMKAFRAALEAEYGVFGTNAFDTVVGARSETHKSLRAVDVKRTLSNLPAIRHNHFVFELARQLDTSPRVLELPPDLQAKISAELSRDFEKGVDLEACKTREDVAAAAQSRLEAAIHEVYRKSDIGAEDKKIAGRPDVSAEAAPGEATGLRNLSVEFGGKSTSVADRIKRGLAGAGMRVNHSETNPVILEKLKTNGVEPGYIYRKDWSTADTRGFMSEYDTEASRNALAALKADNPALAAACEGKTLREQIMLAGRAHPAAMSAVAEFVLQNAAQNAEAGRIPQGYPFKALAEGLKRHFSGPDLAKIADGTANKSLVKEAKQYLFAQIRDAVMSVGPENDFYGFSPVFKHFADRAIMKLDYNEGDKFSKGDSAHAGTFMRPERVAIGRKMGQLYRFTSRQSADEISAGAVTEALANDLTRIAGVPSQELEIVRAEYSDGHPKIMLAAKFANGYKDLEAGMLVDGRVVKPKDAPPGMKMESLGKYKAFFLLTADRDGVGRRGQNKGFVNGRFFAIDPGHSLEGNGRYLDISDDFSFKDTFKGGIVKKPRFDNFSVFDDDTRFAKLSGLVNLRRIAQSGAFQAQFDSYKNAFNPDAPGLGDAERALRRRICLEIDGKKAEFDQQLSRLFKIFAMQLELHDSLAGDGPEMQEKAVNTLSHLEMLTSPTTWVSKKGKVALEHLEVKPETRTPWRAGVDGDSIVFHCDKPLDGSVVDRLQALASAAGADFTYDNYGCSTLSIPKAQAERFFAVFSEENVQKLTHPEEYEARKTGGDPLKTARDYTPPPFRRVPDPRPPLTVAQLPESLDVQVGGRIVRMPRIHYERIATTVSSVGLPRSVDNLRSSINARVKRGMDILAALRNGQTARFEPSVGNVVALTFALHALALAQGQYMYRGSFSVADPEGNIARWLDGCKEVYPRASTHATPFHSMTVDGHRNEARGIDVPEGMGGLLNGMRTLHYFTIPDTDHLNDAGGSGPRRRLFLKCETFGVFVNKISAENAKASLADGMKPRSYKFGDLLESVTHGLSLFASYFTPKEAPGIQKENLLEAQKRVVDAAEAGLRAIGEDNLADMLVRNVRGKGAGIRQIMDNLAQLLEQLPAEENKRAQISEIAEGLIEGLMRASGNLPGELSSRMGNEIMIG